MTGGEQNPEKPSEQPSEQLQLALKLLGNKIRFHHWAPGSGIKCSRIHSNGMVELHGIAGTFAPQLFEIDGEVAAVPLVGEVE